MATIRRRGNLEAALKELFRKVSKKSVVRVGFLEGATYPDGTPVALVAAVHNFGAPAKGIPPRPFFSNMVADKGPGWPKAVGENLKATDYDAAKTLTIMGEGISGQLRESVIATNTPPLSAKTIKRKGSAKPLVDTGHMLNSIDYEVE